MYYNVDVGGFSRDIKFYQIVLPMYGETEIVCCVIFLFSCFKFQILIKLIDNIVDSFCICFPLIIYD
jgi:hypothetical protein